MTIPSQKASLSRRDFMEIALVGGLAFAARAVSAEGDPPPGRKPNLILIVADDLGYADLSCQGGTEIPTPHIDSLAKGGVRFTNGYVSCPVCSPTRAGLLTGRYQQRFGHEFNPGQDSKRLDASGEPIGLSLEETTLADLLKSAGYKTCMVGKWHLGEDAKFNPLNRGFDEFFGFLPGSHPYLKADSNRIMRGFEKIEENEYLTDAFAREAVAAIDRHKAAPFFLYLTFNAVHAPMQATQKYLDRFPNLSGDRKTHAAMLSAMDDAVGMVLKKLADESLDKDTLIFFISDNGGPTPSTTASNEPLRATKGTVYEGGVRVPFMAHWPNGLPSGVEFSKPVISLDILPTFAACAGGQLPSKPIDGVNLAPFLKGGTASAPHETLYWRFGKRSAVRHGDWKLVRIAEQPPELYNLAEDIEESENLAAQHPETVQKLAALYAEWEKGLAPPRWSPGNKRAAWQDEAEKKVPTRKPRRKARNKSN